MLSDVQLTELSNLVRRFEKLSKPQRKQYQETEVRTNFIDPLFTALGWPMQDRDHVEREPTVLDSKRPDYVFKLRGVPYLYLEAKRFTEDIRSLHWASDAITKAYNKGVGWAGLTNFTDLVVYDAYELVSPGARPRTVLDLSYDRFAEPGSLLYELSPGSLESHEMERRAQEAGIRTRTIPIEKRLYQSMREWRESLINDMVRWNNWTTEAQYAIADEAVQRLLDRLLFLRHCEDRGITEPQLRSLLHQIDDRRPGVRVTSELLKLFGWAAGVFDSEIFETDAIIDVQFRALADITDFDNTLGDVVRGLYAVPFSMANYDFSQMDADVLGQVYEQYLGHVAQQAGRITQLQPSIPGMALPAITVEGKRQRRRERGIYYTPAWVVQYVVQETLGRSLEENQNRQDNIDNVAILDPACGSGSFLIRAYETLLDYHARASGGDVAHLETRARERVLRQNIYGIDLDPQAVEIARLNLLIRMVREQELLPQLRDNIELGNSLVNGDEDELRPFFGPRWKEKAAFKWASRFPRVMERGGFDVIIGNPPYIRIQTLPKEEVRFFNENFEAATGNYDIYCLFVERSLQLLRPGGYLGFIIPNKFMQTAYGKGLRKLLTDQKAVFKIVDFGDAQIFESGTNYTCLLFLRKGHNRAVTYVPVADAFKTMAAPLTIRHAEKLAFSTKLDGSSSPWVFAPAREETLMRKLRSVSLPLSEASEKVFVGLQTSADDVYILERLGEEDDRLRVRSKRTKRNYLLEKALLKPLLSGQHIGRYSPLSSRQVLLFPYSIESRRAKLISVENFTHDYPAAWDYLNENKERLESRESGKFKGDRWYEFGRSQNLGLHEEPKICVPRLLTRWRL